MVRGKNYTEVETMSFRYKLEGSNGGFVTVGIFVGPNEALFRHVGTIRLKRDEWDVLKENGYSLSAVWPKTEHEGNWDARSEKHVQWVTKEIK